MWGGGSLTFIPYPRELPMHLHPVTRFGVKMQGGSHMRQFRTYGSMWGWQVTAITIATTSITRFEWKMLKGTTYQHWLVLSLVFIFLSSVSLGITNAAMACI